MANLNEKYIRKIIISWLKCSSHKLQQFISIKAKTKIQTIAIKKVKAIPKVFYTNLTQLSPNKKTAKIKPQSQTPRTKLNSIKSHSNLIDSFINTCKNKCIINNKKW